MAIEVTSANNFGVIDASSGVISNSINTSTTTDNQIVGTNPVLRKGDKGDKGDTGNGIASITLTSTADLVDTYTILFTDGTETTFDVTNGEDGEQGTGIQSIEKTSTSGLVDTYTITFTNGNSATFDVTNGQNGQNGQDGQDGQDGEDGYSPSASVSKNNGVSTLTVTDKTGTTTVEILDGEDGQTGATGADGQDGFSPTATVVKNGNKATITITDKNGTTTADVYDGQGGSGTVTDVQVDGVSVVTGGVADITISNAGISGSYNDLTNKPTIPDAQIQADYNQTDNTKVDYIKNKPDLSTKQDTLVSGTNIKTINSTSVLGAGNLETLNYNQISNCILEAPNGVYSINGRTLTIKSGVKVLIPNGRNSDNTLKNIEYTLPSDVSIDYSIYSAGGLILVFLTSGGTGFPVTMSKLLGSYKYVTQLPSTVDTTATYFAYCDYNNYWYKTSGSTTADWQTASVVPIVPLYFATSTTMTSMAVYSNPIKIADSNMIDGKWIPKHSVIANGVSWGSTAKTYSLFDYLPKDNFNYEVLIGSSVTTGSSSGNYVTIMINNNLLGDAASAGHAVTRSAASAVDSCTIILPISTERNFVVGASTGSSKAVGTYTLRAVAYRRIGNNG